MNAVKSISRSSEPSIFPPIRASSLLTKNSMRPIVLRWRTGPLHSFSRGLPTRSTTAISSTQSFAASPARPMQRRRRTPLSLKRITAGRIVLECRSLAVARPDRGDVGLLVLAQRCLSLAGRVRPVHAVGGEPAPWLRNRVDGRRSVVATATSVDGSCLGGDSRRGIDCKKTALVPDSIRPRGRGLTDLHRAELCLAGLVDSLVGGENS